MRLPASPSSSAVLYRLRRSATTLSKCGTLERGPGGGPGGAGGGGGTAAGASPAGGGGGGGVAVASSWVSSRCHCRSRYDDRVAAAAAAGAAASSARGSASALPGILYSAVCTLRPCRHPSPAASARFGRIATGARPWSLCPGFAASVSAGTLGSLGPRFRSPSSHRSILRSDSPSKTSNRVRDDIGRSATRASPARSPSAVTYPLASAAWR